MFGDLTKNLEELLKTEIVISAIGVYPVKKQTKVAHVAKYQNDGTETITPSKFVERAEDANDGWEDEINKAIVSFLFDGNRVAFNIAGRRVARDINRKVDRIDTHRLMHSMRHLVRKK